MLQIPFLDLNLIYAIAVGFHGAGHLIGIFLLGPIQTKEFTQESWILQGKLGLSENVTRGLALLWIVATAGFLGVATGFWSGIPWWRVLGWIMVPLSVLLFILWAKSFPTNIPIQAQIGNVVTVLGLLFL